MNHRTSNLKAQGTWEVKRLFVVPTLDHEQDAEVVVARISSLKGVRAAQTDIARHRLTVVYDITKLAYRDLQAVLDECGFPVSDTLWSRIKAKWFQGGDEIGRENAHAPAAPCCNNPDSILRQRDR